MTKILTFFHAITNLSVKLCVITLIVLICIGLKSFYKNPTIPAIPFTEKEFEPLSHHDPDCFKTGIHTNKFKEVVLHCPPELILKYAE